MKLEDDLKMKAYKDLMEHRTYGNDRYGDDHICAGCPLHKPKWKYRFCRFEECVFIKGFKTYREEYYR